jgi:hypothetical protein
VSFWPEALNGKAASDPLSHSVYSPGELAQTAWHRQSAVLAAANSKKSIYSQIKSFFFFVIFLLLEVNHTTVDGFHIRLTKLDHSFRLTRQTNVELLLKHTTTAMSNKKFDSYLKVDFEHFERSSCVQPKIIKLAEKILVLFLRSTNRAPSTSSFSHFPKEKTGFPTRR